MTPQEPTTILPGAPGVPTVVVRDHDGWRAQVEAENRAKADQEIKALLADIARGEEERKYARRPSVAEQKRSLDRIEAESRERRDGPGRVAAMLDAEEAIITAMLAQVPEPPPQPERYGRPLSTAELAYEEAQAAWRHKQARPAGGGCGYCNTCRDGGGQWCLNR